MARQGMDVDVVTQHGQALKTIGDSELPSLVARVDGLVGDVQQNWWGPDAQQFHSAWTGTDKPAMQTIAHALGAFGQKALVNAQEQAKISSSAGTV